MELRNLLKEFPFIAITRGITPKEAGETGSVLYETGFRIMETPLNSPDPYSAIKCMAETLKGRALVGAGTVTTTDQVHQVQAAGGQIIISPHCDPEIIRVTKAEGMYSIPGVATPTEAFAALRAGADALKLFPAEIISPQVVRAMRAILPQDTLLLPVGSILSTNWAPYWEAGADGFGLGSSLYKKGISSRELKGKGEAFANSWRQYAEPAR